MHTLSRTQQATRSAVATLTSRLLFLGFVVGSFLHVPSAAAANGASGCVTIGGNLDSRTSVTSALPAGVTSFNTLNSAANFSTFFDVYDVDGAKHTLTGYFFHLGTHSWEFRVYTDGQELIGGTSGTASLLGACSLTFDTNGNRTNVPNVDITDAPPWLTASQLYTLTFSFMPMTETASPSNIGNISEGCVHFPPSPTPSPTASPTPSPTPTPTPMPRASTLDVDGDGIDDFGVYRRNLGIWFIRRSSDGELMMKRLGLPGDVPMPGDYDGDGKSDLAVFRPTNGFWYICSSATGYDCDRYSAQQFGLPGDLPIRGDFDGDGILDLAVWRPGNQSLYYKSSKDGSVFVLQWGLPKDVPLGTSPSK